MKSKNASTADMPMEFSRRTMRMLLRMGIRTYEDIDNVGRREICRMRGCGHKTIDEIENKMKELGYNW